MDNIANRSIIKAKRKFPGRSLTGSHTTPKLEEDLKKIGISYENSIIPKTEIQSKKQNKSVKDIKQNMSYKIFPICGSCRILFFCIKVCIPFSLIVAWLFSVVLWHDNQCKLDSELFDLRVNKKLSNCIIGQENSVNTIIKAIELFNNDITHNNEQVIHLMWWVGSIGVGKTMMTNILIQSFKGVHVIKHIMSSVDNQNNVESLAKYLLSMLHCCKINLLIIDGYNAEEDASYMLIEHILYKVHSGEKNEFSKSFCLPYKILIIVTGIHKSNIITKHYLHSKSFHNGHARKMNSIHDMIILMKDKFIIKDDFNLVKHFQIVPFLPLEFTHMEKCILQTLNERILGIKCHHIISEQLEIVLKFHNLSLNMVSKKIKKKLHAFPSDTPTILSSGCKSISHKIGLIVNL